MAAVVDAGVVPIPPLFVTIFSVIFLLLLVLLPLDSKLFVAFANSEDLFGATFIPLAGGGGGGVDVTLLIELFVLESEDK